MPTPVTPRRSPPPGSGASTFRFSPDAARPVTRTRRAEAAAAVLAVALLLWLDGWFRLPGTRSSSAVPGVSAPGVCGVGRGPDPPGAGLRRTAGGRPVAGRGRYRGEPAHTLRRRAGRGRRRAAGHVARPDRSGGKRPRLVGRGAFADPRAPDGRRHGAALVRDDVDPDPSLPRRERRLHRDRVQRSDAPRPGSGVR